MNSLLPALLLVFTATSLKHYVISSAEARQQTPVWSTEQLVDGSSAHPTGGQKDLPEAAEKSLTPSGDRPQTVVLTLDGSQRLLGQVSADD
jgi:hypothetical protein